MWLTRQFAIHIIERYAKTLPKGFKARLKIQPEGRVQIVFEHTEIKGLYITHSAFHEGFTGEPWSCYWRLKQHDTIERLSGTPLAAYKRLVGAVFKLQKQTETFLKQACRH